MSRARGLDVVGADSGGLVSSLFSAAGAGVDYAKQDKADKASAQSDNAKLAAAVAADKAATTAVAKAAMSALVVKKDPSKSGAAKADKMAADAAVKVQDKAGADMPDSKKGDRTSAAQDVLDGANSGLQDALRSGDPNRQALAQCTVDAAQETLDKTKGLGGGSKSAGGGGGGSSGSFFSKTIYGPIKVWMAGLAVAAGGGLYLWRRK